MSNKTLTIGVLVAIVIAIGGYFFPQIQSAFGSVGTRFPNGLAVGTTATVTQNKLTIGNSGTAIGDAIYGTCALTVPPWANIPATTSKPFDCAVTGVVSTAVVIAQIATTTASPYTTFGGWSIEGADASSTAGFITVVLRNGTGAVSNPSQFSFASTTAYQIFQ